MMYTTATKKWPKNERKTKKLLSPLVRIQPINKITKGHQAYNYVQFGPRNK